MLLCVSRLFGTENCTFTHQSSSVCFFVTTLISFLSVLRKGNNILSALVTRSILCVCVCVFYSNNTLPALGIFLAAFGWSAHNIHAKASVGLCDDKVKSIKKSRCESGSGILKEFRCFYTQVPDINVFEYMIIRLVNVRRVLLLMWPKSLEVSMWMLLHENVMYLVYNQGQ